MLVIRETNCRQAAARPRNPAPRRQRGFSLIEVLVAVVIVAIGLLGLAKMETVALSSTAVSSTRSLVAIQASSLAASMHANRGFWGTGIANAVYTVDATAANNYSSATACTTVGACTPQQMAAYDLQQWQLAMQALIPSKTYGATITCTTTLFPVNCTINIQWTENIVANDSSQTFTANQSLMIPTYTIYVQP